MNQICKIMIIQILIIIIQQMKQIRILKMLIITKLIIEDNIQISLNKI